MKTEKVSHWAPVYVPTLFPHKRDLDSEVQWLIVYVLGSDPWDLALKKICGKVQH